MKDGWNTRPMRRVIIDNNLEQLLQNPYCLNNAKLCPIKTILFALYSAVSSECKTVYIKDTDNPLSFIVLTVKTLRGMLAKFLDSRHVRILIGIRANPGTREEGHANKHIDAREPTHAGLLRSNMPG